jgi:hypothetical protein
VWAKCTTNRPGDKVSQIKNEGNVEVAKTGQEVAQAAAIAVCGSSFLPAKKPRRAGNPRWQSNHYR